jgi:hypothetical protein
VEGNWTWRGKRIECVFCHSQGHSEASWHAVCPCPTSIVCVYAQVERVLEGTSYQIPGVLWFRCRNHILLHLFLMPRRPTSTHGLLDRSSETRGSFTRPIGFLTKA